MNYQVGQEVEIAERYSLARSSGYVKGPAKYSTATVTAIDDNFAHLSTGERIDLETGKLLRAEVKP